VISIYGYIDIEPRSYSDSAIGGVYLNSENWKAIGFLRKERFNKLRE
jgi:hypothetical protein